MNEVKGTTYQERFEAAFGKVSFHTAVGLLSGTRNYNHQQHALLSETSRDAPLPVGFFRFIKVPSRTPGVSTVVALANTPELSRKVNSIRRRQWVEKITAEHPGVTRKTAISIWCSLRGNPTELALITADIIALFVTRASYRVGVKLSELKDMGMVATNPIHRRLVSILNSSFLS